MKYLPYHSSAEIRHVMLQEESMLNYSMCSLRQMPVYAGINAQISCNHASVQGHSCLLFSLFPVKYFFCNTGNVAQDLIPETFHSKGTGFPKEFNITHLSKSDGFISGDKICIFTSKYSTVTAIQLLRNFLNGKRGGNKDTKVSISFFSLCLKL